MFRLHLDNINPHSFEDEPALGRLLEQAICGYFMAGEQFDWTPLAHAPFVLHEFPAIQELEMAGDTVSSSSLSAPGSSSSLNAPGIQLSYVWSLDN